MNARMIAMPIRWDEMGVSLNVLTRCILDGSPSLSVDLDKPFGQLNIRSHVINLE